MFKPLPARFDFPAAEKEILAFWDEHDVFHASVRLRADAPRFVFYEGPPTANGMPHPGHCLTRVMKDIFPRYQTMCGRLVERKGGWDTHGLPVEREVCKELGIRTKHEIEAYGVEKFNLKCIQSVFRYTREWEEMTRRLAYWVDLKEAYVTYHQSYVESVWWSLKTLFDRGVLYQGHKVVWWWAQGGTALSSGEVGEGYKTVDDPSVFVKFPLVEEAGGGGFGGTGVPPVLEGKQPAGGTGVPPVSSAFTIRRRYLPHWEAGGSTYFVTFRVRSGDLSESERTQVLSAAAHFDGERYLLHAAVVMPDHVHLLLTPLERKAGEWWPLAGLLHSIKSFTGHAISQQRGGGEVWMEEYFDRIIRSQTDFDEKMSYILGNPAKRGLPDNYQWVWFEDSHAHRKEAGGTGVSSGLKNGRDARTTQSTLPRKTSLLVWTTTPWTLISNHFAAVHPELEYALVHDPVDDEHLYIAAALVETIAKKVKRELRVVSTCNGSTLLGLSYMPPFDCYWAHGKVPEAAYHEVVEGREWVAECVTPGLCGAKARLAGGGEDLIGWRVLAADFVTIDSGTGIVHEAPAFGEVDFNLLQQERARFEDRDALPVLCAVAPDGTFNSDAPEKYRGRWVKDCDKDIIRELRDERKTPWGTPLLYHQEQYRHDYPFCPQAPDDPLIQYARKSWFVRTSLFKEEFLKNNAAINWLPEHIKEGRFGDLLRNNVDWALSRERFWGTPLPIWVCGQTGKMEAIGSFAELQAKPGATDGGYWEQKVAEHKGETFPEHLRVHKPYIDEWTYDSPFAPGERMKRVPEVIDCWWDAGSMPFAQWGFPHADGSVDKFSQRFPADFISEAIDQTRGWFYGLLAISTLLFGQGAMEQSLIAGRTGSLNRMRKRLSELPSVTAAACDKALEELRRDPNAAADIARGPAAGEQDLLENVALDYPMPFRTCIVLGHIAGEDGNKMSKKLRNYKEPTYIFDTLGADAMRWYFLSAQAPWTSTRFAEAAIRDAQREFLVKLYNVLSFFTIYASIDGFDPSKVGNIHFAAGDDPRTPGGSERSPGGRSGDKGKPMGWRPTAERTELDRWIATELRRTVAFVRESMDRFENFPAAQRLNDFVDALSNWFVRRSRDRFWRGLETAPEAGVKNGWSAADQEKWDAYHTLYGCLRVLSHLIAPFVPFFAEKMHQVLRVPGDPISIHLCDYPKPEDIRFFDEKLAATMDTVRELVALGRAARTGAKLKVRQPLARVELVLTRASDAEAVHAHAALIAEELNVKNVELVADADKYVTYKVVPNFKAIGAKFRELVPKLKEALGKLADPAAARRTLLESGALPLALDGRTVTLTPEEVEIRLEARAGWSAAQGRAGVVVLSTEITPELRDEGLMRELIHHVQAARKEMNLAYQARVVVDVDGPAELLAVVRRLGGVLEAECLATAVNCGPQNGAAWQEVDIEGHAARIAIRSL